MNGLATAGIVAAKKAAWRSTDDGTPAAWRGLPLQPGSAKILLIASMRSDVIVKLMPPRFAAACGVALIVGTAGKAAYYYVSPCNACESGFVPQSAVLMP